MNEEKRYTPIENSIIEACREVNQMRAGKLPEPSLDDFFAEMEEWISEEKARANCTDKKIQIGR